MIKDCLPLRSFVMQVTERSCNNSPTLEAKFVVISMLALGLAFFQFWLAQNCPFTATSFCLGVGGSTLPLLIYAFPFFFLVNFTLRVKFELTQIIDLSRFQVQQRHVCYHSFRTVDQLAVEKMTASTTAVFLHPIIFESIQAALFSFLCLVGYNFQFSPNAAKKPNENFPLRIQTAIETKASYTDSHQLQQSERFSC